MCIRDRIRSRRIARPARSWEDKVSWGRCLLGIRWFFSPNLRVLGREVRILGRVGEGETGEASPAAPPP
eukprot:2199111-Prorocentrum_lima.AAC.1